ncbi:MAG TPA: amidohydrolase family protein [Steroidobacter sp.]|uniref:amidohydrolase family protein n=1 Tax=Steroidobacter sp. TaxID=1978227 RepID=UPI002ED9D3E9
MSAQGVTFINGAIESGASTLRIVGSRMASVGEGPEPGDVVIDLHDARLLPGLINAHDHLQLNNFGRLKYRSHYTAVGDWIADVAAYLQTNAQLKAFEAVPREQRVLLGGIKNLLSGVTTVAHHDPLYGCLISDAYPVSVVSQYGWSHSLLIDGEERVRRSYQATPAAWPWIIHAAEGIDETATAEFEQLDALGCIAQNTLIVHGIALKRVQRQRLIEAGAGLIWCPASNLHLFDHAAEVGDLIERGRVALGTDSRLSGSRDLLNELKVAREIAGLDDRTLQALVTTNSAQLLRLTDRGVLRAGAAADILVVPRMPLADASRADICLVMSRGKMLYADRHYAGALAPPSSWVEVSVDGRPKAMDRRLAMLWAQSGLQEPGLDVSAAGWRAA